MSKFLHNNNDDAAAKAIAILPFSPNTAELINDLKTWPDNLP